MRHSPPAVTAAMGQHQHSGRGVADPSEVSVNTTGREQICPGPPLSVGFAQAGIARRLRHRASDSGDRLLAGPGARHQVLTAVTITTASGSVNRRPEGDPNASATAIQFMIADAVRYTSVHSWKQPDSHGLSRTHRTQSSGPRTRRNPKPRAVSAGGGRSRIRTWEGEADGFTDRSLWPLGQPALCRSTGRHSEG
jgi:hypothetical protein